LIRKRNEQTMDIENHVTSSSIAGIHDQEVSPAVAALKRELRTAAQFMKSRKYAEAIEIYSRCLALPTISGAMTSSPHNEGSVQALDVPTRFDCLINRSACYCANEQVNGAVADANEALALFPSNEKVTAIVSLQNLF
jgi:tetratricopeptide (TPR) repeat protein